MSSVQIKDNIYWVGILNPAMRIFDVVMKTEFGTSYNSYVVKGSEKIALIETSHARFSEQYFNNIREVCEPKDINYIVLNHCEPDHSGSLRELLKLCPNAEILVSKPGSNFLKAITNLDNLPLRIINQGDSVDLGGKSLDFYIAPFLHWPDSMFTYLKSDKMLFPCDFFGSHYCEPYVMDTSIEYTDKYKSAFKGYYDAIFGPFAQFVKAGLAITDKLEIDTICSSHGPVLTKGNQLDYVVKKYHDWCEAEAKTKIPVFYCSAYGNTKQIAEKIAEGISEIAGGDTAFCFDINEHGFDVLSVAINSSKAFVIGSPTINSDAVKPVWDLISCIDAVGNRNRPALVFGSYGWSGEAVPSIVNRLRDLKCKVFGDGMKVNFVPSELDLENAYNLGKEFAQNL